MGPSFWSRHWDIGSGQTKATAGLAMPVSVDSGELVSLAASGYLSCESSILTGCREVIQQCEQLVAANSSGNLRTNGLAVML
jgi:hypothetical protein